MIVRFKIFIKWIALLFFLSTTGIHAQMLKDTSIVNLIKKDIGYFYNFQFKDAYDVYGKISQLYPGHPIIYLLKGILTYWENYPLLATSPSRRVFEENLRTCIELCEKKHNPEDETDYLLANLCARGMLLLFYTDNSLPLEVFPLATSTYQYIRRSFSFTSVYYDFYFFTGIYNYTREAYPEAYPVYKPLALLFPKGDKSKGIKDLQKAAANSIVLRAESLSFLSDIFIGFENNYYQASYYSKSLYKLYPANPEYLADYIRNLLLTKQYDEAEKLIPLTGSPINNSFFKAQLNIFKGILREKKYSDYKQAQEFYLKGVREITLFGKFGNDYAAYAYFGLSRISEVNGDQHNKKLYSRMANELADLKKVNFD